MLERRSVAALLLASGLGLGAQYLFFRQTLGLNFPIVIALTLAAAWRLRSPDARPRAIDLWLPACAILFAVFCALRADAPLLVSDVLASLTLTMASIAAMGGVRVSSLPVGGLVTEALGMAGRSMVAAFRVVADSWPLIRLLSPRLARASGPIGGVALAAPFLVVFAALFSSADAVFARSVDQVLDLKRLGELLGESPARLLVAFLIAWPAAGAFTTLWRPPRDHTAGAHRLLAADSATVALGLIVALFAVFVGMQLAYLFGGRDTVDAAAISYSSYARRGFFELIAVASLAGGLLFGLDLVLRDRGRAYLAMALALIALTGVVLVSAAYRLDLYQRAYGWSELRFYAFAATAFLACALAILAWSVVRGRMPFVAPPLVAAGAAVLIAANLIGPSGFIARMNLGRVIDPSGLPDDAERRLDTGTLWSLGPGALPDVVARVDRLPAGERERVEQILLARTRCCDPRGAPDWRGWNFDHERARAALADWEDRRRR